MISAAQSSSGVIATSMSTPPESFDIAVQRWLSFGLPRLTGTVSQLFRKVKLVQKGSFRWSKWLAMNVSFLFVFHGAPDTRMLVNNPAWQDTWRGTLCVEGHALMADRSGRDHKGYSLPVQTSFPRTKTTTREPKFPIMSNLLSFCFVNITSGVCRYIQMEHAMKQRWGASFA